MEKERSFKNNVKELYKQLLVLCGIVFLFAFIGITYMVSPESLLLASDTPKVEITSIDPEQDDWDKVENGIHLRTGLKEAEGYMAVVNNCTNCHSAQLVMQNRMNEERWIATIRWMQETQNLWDLGENEAVIVNYLVTNYPVISKGRRESLSNIEWYELKE
ncbi:hypothetical protein SAMN04487911_10527 [Arenibacter nanhaiticus]|uniref:Sulfite dehydrogenase (Cytochrome) subunit SorB n=1 Tax=Arenibacter nanhaiticus TaxID=558155 RepID=A0A1M6DJ97_9FLAO|nr:monoheme cytochrome C [Arenibacter nanhaiticus]SHI73078.1 hypothetical protein SAMN04487911_10527 [Arenibacter nanhaiticus]